MLINKKLLESVLLFLDSFKHSKTKILIRKYRGYNSFRITHYLKRKFGSCETPSVYWKYNGI